ncbi:MAG: DUF502 domain-containing protein [Elusimicrobia bacterium]|nr:DUF502 domain-containing protein [Elusimicrobiota bacterium]
MRKLAGYFFQGLLLVGPFAATVYILYVTVSFLDGLLPVGLPGLGLLIIIGLITLLGYLGSLFIARPFITLFEKIVEKTPLVKIIYTAVKDLMTAFVGEKKRFSEPVLVTVGKDSGLQKLGFITQKDLSDLGIKGKVAVYLPHSYNFSGNLFIVPKENVMPLDISGAEIMKFIVSGGVTRL